MGVMDLENMDVPDNHGGRPPKEETDDESRRREYTGDPYTMAHGKEYWDVKWEKWYHEEDNEVKKAVMYLSGESLCLPRTVVSNLQEHGIHDFNDTLDEYPEAEDYIDDVKSTVTDDVSDDFLSNTENDSKDEPSQGLRSLIDE